MDSFISGPVSDQMTNVSGPVRTIRFQKLCQYCDIAVAKILV